jgi:hypothetical protein
VSFFRGSETVVIKRRTLTGTDDYGNKTQTTTTITVKNCMLGFGGGGEPVDPSRDPVDANFTIYFPSGTQIHDGDRFIIRNTEFVKDGPAQDWGTANPVGLDAGVIVQVRKRNG